MPHASLGIGPSRDDDLQSATMLGLLLPLDEPSALPNAKPIAGFARMNHRYLDTFVLDLRRYSGFGLLQLLAAVAA